MYWHVFGRWPLSSVIPVCVMFADFLLAYSWLGRKLAKAKTGDIYTGKDLQISGRRPATRTLVVGIWESLGLSYQII